MGRCFPPLIHDLSASFITYVWPPLYTPFPNPPNYMLRIHSKKHSYWGTAVNKAGEKLL